MKNRLGDWVVHVLALLVGIVAFGPMAHAAVDCTERTDTGYVSGTPYPITVVTVDGKPVERDTANAFVVMQQAAAADGVFISIVSGFRTQSEQQYLYNCYVNCNCNNCNLAAVPGYSNHQSGHALDLNSSAPGVYNWLVNHAGSYGFSATVPGEPWHWEWWGGGPGGGPCAACEPACNGSEIIGTDCSVGDCAAFGSNCVDDELGVRCAFVFCPTQGQASLCLDDETIGYCDDGAITSGDCSAFAGLCSTAGADEARCVSIFCVDSPDTPPVAHDGCFFDGAMAHCDGNGALSATPCPSGEICSVFPEPHCEPNPGCPGSGEADVCVSDTVIGHCNFGSVLTITDCGNDASYCSTAGGSAPRCVPTACLDSPAETPSDKTVCVDTTTLGHCTAAGAITLEACGAGERCDEALGTCVADPCVLGPAGCTPNGEVYSCDAGGNLTVSPCPAGSPCQAHPTPACVPSGSGPCPETGETSVCLDESLVGRCVDGVLMGVADCGETDAFCQTESDGEVACVAVGCEGRAGEEFCLGDSQFARCDVAGNLTNVRCPPNYRCRQEGTEAVCVGLSAPTFGDFGPGADVAEGTVGVDGAELLDGPAPENCACRTHGSSDPRWPWWPAALVFAGLLLGRRRR